MFWSGSGAFMRRHADSGEVRSFDWRLSVGSRLDPTGRRRLGVIHLSCSRQPADMPDEREDRAFEIRLGTREAAGGGLTEDSLLCLRVSDRAFDLWIAAAGPRREDPPMPIDGGAVLLDGPGDARGR
jgi:hypothetical protein